MGVTLFQCRLYRYYCSGPPTHSVGGQTSNGRWCTSVVVVCNAPRRRNVTHQGQHAAGQ